MDTLHSDMIKHSSKRENVEDAFFNVKVARKTFRKVIKFVGESLHDFFLSALTVFDATVTDAVDESHLCLGRREDAATSEQCFAVEPSSAAGIRAKIINRRGTIPK